MINKSGALSRYLAFIMLMFVCALSRAENQDNIDYLFSYSLEELLAVKVRVASLFPESELNVPSTVMVVTPKDWYSKGDRRSSEALFHQPGVLVMHTYGGSKLAIIRGYAQSNSSRGIATLVDGVVVNDAFFGTAQPRMANWNLGTLNRIEMIRGPGSAIYGSSAFHGVISYETFESDEDRLWTHSEVGSNRFGEASLQYSTALNEKARLNVSLSVSGHGAQDRPYQFTIPTSGAQGKGNRSDEYFSQTAVIKLQGKIHNDYEYKLGYYYNEYDASGGVGIGRFYGASHAQNQDDSVGQAYFNMATAQLSRNIKHNINVQLLGYYWHDSLFSDTDSGNFGGDRWELISRDHNSGYKLTFKQQDNSWHTRWVAQLQQDRIQLDDAKFDTINQDGSSAGIFTYATQGDSRTTDSLVVQADTALLDEKLHLIYGGRWDDYSDFGEQRTPRLGMIYHPDKKSALKLLYGEAFRAPTFLELASTSTVLKPELIATYELVYMKQGSNWKTEWVIFDSQWQDRIVLDSASDAIGDFGNIGANEAKGVEVLFNWVGESTSNNVNFSYVTSKDKDNDVKFEGFPLFMVNWDLGYKLSNYQSEIHVINQLLSHMNEGSVRDKIITKTESISDYWRTDVTINRRYSPELSLSLNIRNLFDRDDAIPSSSTAENGILGEKFSVSLALEYRL